MCYAQTVTWGQLAAEIDAAMAPALPAAQQRDLPLVMEQHIVWQETGTGPSQALNLPALFAVVRLIASTIDQLEITVDGGRAPIWLRKPRKYGSHLDQGDLIQHTVTQMALRGHATLQVERVGGSWKIDALHPSSVQVRTTSSGVIGLEYLVDGVVRPRVPVEQGAWQDGQRYVLPIPYLVTDQHPEGTSPVREAWQAISGYLKVEAQAANLLDSGTYSGGRLETDADITADTARRFRDQWIENRRLGVVPVLGAGLRYVNDIIEPDKAQWIESRLANAQTVASMYGVPPDMLGMTMAGGSSSLSYANAQDNNRRFRTNCLEAFTSQIATALTSLLPPGRGNEAEEQHVQFDYTQWEVSAGEDTAPEPGPAADQGQ